MNHILHWLREHGWELLGRYGKYMLVAAVFIVFYLYNFVSLPDLSKRSSSPNPTLTDRMAWDVTSEQPEKVYAQVLQGKTGDWYRVGLSTAANRPSRLDVRLYSVFGQDVLAGSLDIIASDDWRYQEMVFQIPPGGIFSDIRLILQTEDAAETWAYTGIRLSELSLSRLNIRDKDEASRLLPTIVGNVQRGMVLFPDASSPAPFFERRFTADADFTEAVKFNIPEQARNKTYVLTLAQSPKTKAHVKPLKKVILKPGERGALKDKWGNDVIPLSARLERDTEYTILLQSAEKDARGPQLLPLEGSGNLSSDERSIAALVYGRYAFMGKGSILLGARVEDLGEDMLYSYTPSGTENDFFDLFDAEGNVKFDAKKKIIVGERKQNSSFTYRFFTVYPFEKFILAAKQAGDGEGIKMEYSFDNEFWSEIPSQKAGGESKKFSLSVSGNGTQDTLYLKASYAGAGKKSGSFGLEQLTARAQLRKR